MFFFFFLTGVHGAVSVDGGQDSGKWTRSFLLDLVAGQQFELLRRDWWKAVELEGEVDVFGPIGAADRRRCSGRRQKGHKRDRSGCSVFKRNTAMLQDINRWIDSRPRM